MDLMTAILAREAMNYIGNNIFMYRNDEQFYCGKGIVAAIPFDDSLAVINVPAYGTEKNIFGVKSLISEISKYYPNVPEYKIRNAYSKLMMGNKNASTYIELK